MVDKQAKYIGLVYMLKGYAEHEFIARNNTILLTQHRLGNSNYTDIKSFSLDQTRTAAGQYFLVEKAFNTECRIHGKFAQLSYMPEEKSLMEQDSSPLNLLSITFGAVNRLPQDMRRELIGQFVTNLADSQFFIETVEDNNLLSPSLLPQDKVVAMLREDDELYQLANMVEQDYYLADTDTLTC